MLVNLVTPYHPQIDLEDGEATIRLSRTDFANVNYQQGKIVLSFENCRFNKLNIVNSEEIDFKDISIAFFSCILDNIEIGHVATKNITIGFYGCVVKGNINSNNILGVELNNCILKNTFFIIGVQKAVVKFSKENIQLYRWKKLFRNYRINSYADLMGKQSYYISDAKTLEVFSNYDLVAKNDRFKIGLSISYFGQEDDLVTTIADIQLATLSISGNPKGKISIENTKIGSWYIYDFFPTGQVSFFNVEPSSVGDNDIKIGIHRCNLDFIWFDNVAFDKYRIISFYRTKFSKATFTACSFPDNYAQFSRFMPIANVHYPETVSPNYHKDQYEIFLQLKKALEDTGNSYEALKLHSISHEAMRKIKTITWFDKAILSINSWSNSHGLSIKRPFLGFLLCSVPLYILYLLSIGRIFNPNEFDLNLIGYYFSYIDITHRVNFLVEKHELTGWTLFIDYLGKVVVGFFIYQFISAFRKYGKR